MAQQAEGACWLFDMTYRHKSCFTDIHKIFPLSLSLSPSPSISLCVSVRLWVGGCRSVWLCWQEVLLATALAPSKELRRREPKREGEERESVEGCIRDLYRDISLALLLQFYDKFIVVKNIRMRKPAKKIQQLKKVSMWKISNKQFLYDHVQTTKRLAWSPTHPPCVHVAGHIHPFIEHTDRRLANLPAKTRLNNSIVIPRRSTHRSSNGVETHGDMTVFWGPSQTQSPGTDCTCSPPGLGCLQILILTPGGPLKDFYPWRFELTSVFILKNIVL